MAENLLKGDGAMSKGIDFNKVKPSKRTLNEWMWAYALVGPTIIGLIILNIIPIFLKVVILEKEMYLLV